jgi:hypothetical protein
VSPTSPQGPPDPEVFRLWWAVEYLTPACDWATHTYFRWSSPKGRTKTVQMALLTDSTLTTLIQTHMYVRVTCPGTGDIIWGWHMGLLRFCRPDVYPYNSFSSPENGKGVIP